MILRCSSIVVGVAIGDENDNSPIFSENRITLSIQENIPIGTEITQVTATDADSQESGFGIVTYTLQGEGELMALAG